MTDAVAPELLLAHLPPWQILDEMSDAVSIVDVRGSLAYVNNTWLELMGVPDRVLALTSGTSLIQRRSPGMRPDGTDAWQNDLAIHRALKGEEVRDSELIYTRGDGKKVWLDTTARPIRDDAGRVIGALAVSRDVTRLRLLAAAAETRAQELETIINSLADPVIITDRETRGILWNPAYAELLGEPRPGEPSVERVGRFHLRHHDGRPAGAADMVALRTVREGEPTTAEFLATAISGKDISLRVQAAPLRDDNGGISGTVIVIRDVTAVKAAEQQKDEFLSLVSHELRTPVTIISGFTQVLRRSVEGADAPETQRRLSIIERQVNQLTGLINDLLDLTRIGRDHFECDARQLDYRALICTVVDDMRELHPARSFIVTVPDRLIVQGDGPRLRQVLVNLLDNAIKHGPPGSEVCVTIEYESDVVTTYVCDQGPSLPLDERDRVFERFYRIAPKSIKQGGSLGLGLYISQAIVEAHGGSIWVADDDHSSFAFSLPA